jgi:hypothetical protein
MKEAVEFLRAAGEQAGASPARVYAPKVGSFDVLALEIEFENYEECEKYWDAWFASPEGVAFMEEWVQMTEIGGKNEIWTLVD